MRRMLFPFVMVFLIILLASCGVQPSDSSIPVPADSTPAPSPAMSIQSSPRSGPAETPSPYDEGVPSISLDDDKVLDAGTTLAELGGYLGKTEIGILAALSPNAAKVSNGWARTYYYADPGVNIVCRQSDESIYNESIDLPVSFIECDADRVVIGGVKEGMDFAQIQEKLGPSTAQKVERVPGICSYELRYIVNGVRLKFFAWTEDGSDSFNLNIVKTFDTKDDFIRITPEKIGEWFGKSLDELKQLFGETEDPRTANVVLSYRGRYGIAFVNQVDENKDRFYTISLDGRYEISGARHGMTLDEIMMMMGNREIKKLDSQEDPFPYIVYTYKTFRIHIISEGLTGEDARQTIFVIERR